MRRALIAVTLAASLITHPSLWSFVSELWSKSTADEGCRADPWGKCSPVPEPETDEGCGADPWGCPKGS